MKCQENRQNIYNYLDNELSVYEEQRLYNHLSNCDGCRLDMERARGLNNLLSQSITHLDPPEGFADKVMANIEPEAAVATADTPKKAKAFSFKPWIAAAACICLLFAGATNLNQVARFAVDPQAKDGYFFQFQITPKDPREIMALINKEDNQPTTDAQQKGTAPEESSTRDENEPHGTDDEVLPVEPNVDENDGAGQTQIDNDGQKNDEKPNQGTITPKGDNEESPFVTKEPIIIASTNATSSVTLKPLFDKVNAATWSADNNALWYLKQDGDKYRLYESQINGDDAKPISNFNAVGSWSADKRAVAYTEMVDGKSTIWVYDGKEKRNLTPLEGEGDKKAKWAYNPVWSGKGELAFLTDRFGDTEIMVTDLDGNQRRITSTGGNKTAIGWSPDNQELAYCRSWEEKGSKMGEVVVASVNDDTIKKVTPAVKATDITMDWSPDGKYLAVNVQGEQQGVWLASVSDNGWERKFTAKGGGKVIKWSPDGQKVAFSDSRGVFHIMVMKSAGANIDLLSLTSMGTQSKQVAIEWAGNSRRLLLQKALPNKDGYEVWLATLPQATTAY